MIEDPSDPGRGRNGRHHGTGRDPLRPQAADGTLDLRIGQIVVLVDSTSAGNARLRLTANLAKALPAEVIGIGVLSDGNAIPAPALPRAAELGVIGLPTFPVVGATSGRVRPEVAAAETETLQAASGAEQHYRDHMAVHSGIQHEWRVIGHGGLGEMVAYAKKADLTVLGQQDPESSGAGDPGFRPEDVVLASGTPTLITPYTGMSGAIGHSILIAWDGSREAVRAVRDALPLMRDAHRITVLEVDPPSADGPDRLRADAAWHSSAGTVFRRSPKPPIPPARRLATSSSIESRTSMPICSWPGRSITPGHARPSSEVSAANSSHI